MRWLLAVSLMLTAHQGEIPPHPRALRSPESQVRLPTADGRRFRIPAGPTVYLAEDHALPLVEITLALPIGSFLDPPGKAGLSYLTGSQLRRAGTKSLDAEDFDERADDLGARLESSAGTTRSGASLSVPTWSLDGALDLFIDMLSAPAFQADRVDAARTNLLESMSRRNENALDVLQREWDQLMFGPGHFSNRPLTPASLAAIDRQNLIDFHRRYWRPSSMILAVSGDFDPEHLLTRLNDLFSDWDDSDSDDETTTWPPPAPRSVAPPGLYHYEVDVPQAKVLLGHRLPDLLAWNDPDRFALEVMTEILGGGGAISRIAGRLRTAEGLAYRASAHVDPGELWPGSLHVFFETQSTSVAHAVELTLEEIERSRSGPFHARELEVAKRTLLGRLRLDFDTAEETAGLFAQDELIGRPHRFWQDYLEGVGAVSVAAATRATRVHVRPDDFIILVVGRWAEISADASTGESELERISGHQVIHLPERDPYTLEPLDESDPSSRTGSVTKSTSRAGRMWQYGHTEERSPESRSREP